MASAEDIRFANISVNCKRVSVKISDGDLTSIPDITAVNKVYIYDQNKANQIYLSPGDADWDNSVHTVINIVTTATETMVGVVSIEFHNAALVTADSLIDTIYTVAPCQINCCIAKLTDAAIECHCKCDKCKEDLLRAEKVMLMLQGATFAAEQESNYDHAVNMYNKANTLCTEVCACGC